MTDDFEDAVRAAGRGLGSVGDQPTYAGAWQRGRRRRFMKRAAVTAAGACALVAAFATDVGRLPGGSEIEVDDIATEAQGVPAPTAEAAATVEPVATTAPIPTPTADPSASLPSAAAPTSAADDDATGAASAGPAADSPTVEPTAATSAEPTQTPEPVATPTAAPTATAVPTSTPEPTPEPTAVPTAEPTAPALSTVPAPTAESDNPQGSADPLATVDPSVTRDPSGDTSLAPDPDAGGSVDVPQPLPSQQPADAWLTPDAAFGPGPRPCDTSGDGLADSSCDLLTTYPCTGQGDVRIGSLAVDTNADGVADSCVPNVLTTCDTTGDKLGDTACVIEPGVANSDG